MLSLTANAAKGRMAATLDGSPDIARASVSAARHVAVTALKERVEALSFAAEGAGSVVKGSIEGIADIGVATERSVEDVVCGTVQGFHGQGGCLEQSVRGCVSQAVRTARRLGLDAGRAAVAAVTGAVAGAIQSGGDPTLALEASVMAACLVAGEMDRKAARAVERALASVDGASRVIRTLKRA